MLRVAMMGQAAFGKAVLDRLRSDGVTVSAVSAPEPSGGKADPLWDEGERSGLPLVPTTPLAVGALSWTGILGIGLATDPQLLDGGELARHLDATLARLRGNVVSGRGPLEGEEEARA